MTVDKEMVLEALRTVEDPELKRDLVSLGMIRDVEVDDSGGVSLSVVLTTPACPMKARIESDVKMAVGRVPGVKSVKVNLTSSVGANPKVAEMLPGVRNTIGVASGKGGVGKTTVAVNLAVALARSGAKVGLLDADIYGPNVPMMLGVMGYQPEVTARKMPDGQEMDMIIPARSFGLKIMSMGFLIHEDQPVMWRGPMLHSALKQFLTQVDWGELDYLVIDLPPGTGDVQISLIQMVPLSGIVQVTTPQDIALQDVRKGLFMFQSQNVPVLGVVENMSAFVCPHCGQQTQIFAAGGGETLSKHFGVKLLGGIPLDPKVREGGDAGIPVVISHPDSPEAKSIVEIAEKVAAAVSMQNLGGAPPAKE